MNAKLHLAHFQDAHKIIYQSLMTEIIYTKKGKTMGCLDVTRAF